MEWHTELFKHPLVARNWGVTSDAIKEVIRAGRLPLLECETDGAEMLKKRGIDCLTIFLKPPSVEVLEVSPPAVRVPFYSRASKRALGTSLTGLTLRPACCCITAPGPSTVLVANTSLFVNSLSPPSLPPPPLLSTLPSRPACGSTSRRPTRRSRHA